MSILKALQPKVSPLQSGTVTESMLDGSYRVAIDGQIRRITSALATPPARGSQVIVGIVSGKETIIAVSGAQGNSIREVTIHG